MPRYYIMCAYPDAPPAALQDMFGGIAYFATREEADENAYVLKMHGKHRPKPIYVVVEDTGEAQDGQDGPEAPTYAEQLGIVPVVTPGPRKDKP